MKKNKTALQTKLVKKAFRNEIQTSLIQALKEITGKLGTGSKKLEKKIVKGAGKISKELAKEIKINQHALANPDGESNNTIENIEGGKPVAIPTASGNKKANAAKSAKKASTVIENNEVK